VNVKSWRISGSETTLKDTQNPGRSEWIVYRRILLTDRNAFSPFSPFSVRLLCAGLFCASITACWYAVILGFLSFFLLLSISLLCSIKTSTLIFCSTCGPSYKRLRAHERMNSIKWRLWYTPPPLPEVLRHTQHIYNQTPFRTRSCAHFWNINRKTAHKFCKNATQLLAGGNE
jgi:hypothetical protein